MNKRETSSGGKQGDESSVKLEELGMKNTELSYVTSINKPTRTFFAQFCKFPNQELVLFNHMINEHCLSIMEARNKGDVMKAVPKKVRKGDILCAKFQYDDLWYRALVLNRDKENQKYSVMYVDYGNLETVKLADFIQISPKDLPQIERAPFGLTCFVDGSDKFEKKKADKLLDCLMHNYVMIKKIERQTSLQWRIGIPKHAYNIPFWLIFEPENTSSESGLRQIVKDHSTASTLTAGSRPC